MNTFHICYLLGRDLCTGVNIKADTYINAIKEFKHNYSAESTIVYVTRLKEYIDTTF
jgi:hypothetical protein